MQYEVIVGNVGTVYSGTNGFEARKVYGQYKKQSLSGVGRAGGESVVLMWEEEILWECVGVAQSGEDVVLPGA